jgi:hypothetical protein
MIGPRLASAIELRLSSRASGQQEGHPIRVLEVTLVNDTTERIEAYDLEVQIPTMLLKHWNTSYFSERKSEDINFRRFKFDHGDFGLVRPRDRMRLCTFDYCTTCVLKNQLGVHQLVSEAKITAKAWASGNEYTVQKRIWDLRD